MNRITILSLSMGLLALCCSGVQMEKKMSTPETHVYLLIGQSNMAGRGPIGEEEAGPIDDCLLLNEMAEWEPARPPMNRHSTIQRNLSMQKLCPGYGFAKAMLEENEGVTIGLVVNARGNTSIEQWAKGQHYYSEAVARAKEAQKTGVLKGILWHQGEANSKKPDGYLAKLAALVADLRQDLGCPDLPFVAGQINGVPAINDQIARLPETVAGTGFVSSEGLTVMDRWHFDTPSVKLLGRRYAEEILKLEARQMQEKE